MSGFRLDMTPILAGMVKLEAKKKAGLTAFAEAAGKTFEAYAKGNYPWTDRTHTASKRLKGGYEWRGDDIRVTIEQGVDYGVYLEYAHGAKYAILAPTIQACSAKVLKSLNRILK